eukprot:7809044-Lingulodinium_polyedra.AAC.1
MSRSESCVVHCRTQAVKSWLPELRSARVFPLPSSRMARVSGRTRDRPIRPGHVSVGAVAWTTTAASPRSCAISPG